MLRVVTSEDIARLETAKEDAERGEKIWLLVQLVQVAEAASLPELRYLLLTAQAVTGSQVAG